MDEDWKQTIRDLEQVWPRVSGGHAPPPPRPGQGTPPPPPPPPPPADAALLADFIRGETAAERRYLALAARTKGRAASELKRLAAGSRSLVRKLQTEHYLLTGDTCPVPRPGTGGGNREREPFRDGLRQAWLDAREAERAYLDAAGRTGDERLAALFGAAAAEKQRQRKVLWALLQRMLS